MCVKHLIYVFYTYIKDISLYLCPGKGRRLHLKMLNKITPGVMTVLDAERWSRKTFYSMNF